jgi:hypothetical protein
MDKVSLSRGVKLPGRDDEHPPHLAPRSKKDRNKLLFPSYAFTKYYRVNFNNSVMMVCVEYSEVLFGRVRKIAKNGC